MIYNIMTTNKILENYMCHNLQLTLLRFYFKLFIAILPLIVIDETKI